jgi:hypothetical protein
VRRVPVCIISLAEFGGRQGSLDVMLSFMRHEFHESSERAEIKVEDGRNAVDEMPECELWLLVKSMTTAVDGL